MIDIRTGRSSIDAEVGRILAMLRATEDWSSPTRLEGWTVADLAGHLVFGQALQADAWRRLADGDAGEVSVEPVTGLDRDHTLEALEAAHAALDAALAEVEDEQVAAGACAMPYGTLPAGFVLLLATMEAGVHASDLAAARGEADDLGPVTVEATAAVLAGSLPMLGAAGDPPPPGTSVRLAGDGVDLAVAFGDEGTWAVGDAPPSGPTTTIRGSASDVLLFALGRRGAGDVEVDGDPSGADRFKAWFPGP